MCVASNQKKGYLFSLDAFLAITIVFSSLLIVYLSVSINPSTESDAQLSQDAILSLENLRVFSVNDEDILQLRSDNKIVSSQITLLEQIGYFYYTGKCFTNDATAICDEELPVFSKAVMDALIPTQFSYALLLDKNVVAERGELSPQGSDLSVSRSYVFGRNFDPSSTEIFWGPYAVEVRVWR